MTRTVSVTELLRNFSDLLNRVVYRGEHLVLTRGNRVVAELRPVPVGRRLGDLPDVLASLPRLAPGDAEAFARDIDEARAELGTVEVQDPWES